MWLKVAVNSLYWTVVIMIFYLVVDLLSDVNFLAYSYTLPGFIIHYIAIFVYLFNLNYKPK